MADRIEIGWLFDFYGPLLTERQQSCCLILQRGFFPFGNRRPRGISRQGFTTRFTGAARQLEDYERSGLLRRYQSMTQGLRRASAWKAGRRSAQRRF
ncbi:MAG: hypothetical protein ACLUI3_10890 [Christensenellales bacterium]